MPIELGTLPMYYDTVGGLTQARLSEGPDLAANASATEQGFLKSRHVGLAGLLPSLLLLIFLPFTHCRRSAT